MIIAYIGQYEISKITVVQITNLKVYFFQNTRCEIHVF